jgi:hypothetical protein
MRRYDVVHDDWGGFCGRFAERHRGWPVSVSVISRDGRGLLIRGKPLDGVTFERPAGREQVVITTGGRSAPHATHRIVDPRWIVLHSTEEGAEMDLTIWDADGDATAIHLRPPGGNG